MMCWIAIPKVVFLENRKHFLRFASTPFGWVVERPRLLQDTARYVEAWLGLYDACRDFL
jgi:hypothetical protein